MHLRSTLIALATLLLPGAAFAEEAAPAPSLLADSVNLPVVDGSTVPADCHYPASLSNAERYELACVIMPRDPRASGIAAQYIGALGQRGWQQGPIVQRGFAAVRTTDAGCQEFLNIFPSNYPPEQEQAATEVVLWFALDRQSQCAAPQQPQ